MQQCIGVFLGENILLSKVLLCVYTPSSLSIHLVYGLLGWLHCLAVEHRVLYVNDESLNSMPETNIALYVN